MDQPDHQWVDQLLWLFLSFRIVSCLQTDKQSVALVGKAEIQKAATPQNEGRAIHGKNSQNSSLSICPLANRNERIDGLMGAV